MFISLRKVKFLHPIFQEFKWLQLCFVQKFENSNRIFGRFLGRWLFWGNYFKLSECRWHVLRIWWKTIKKINPGLFDHYTCLSLDLRNIHLNWVLETQYIFRKWQNIFLHEEQKGVKMMYAYTTKRELRDFKWILWIMGN